MHKIHHTVRRIADADLPKGRDENDVERPATDDELLNLGIIRLADDIYSCVEQVRRDPETLEWKAVGHSPVGELLSHGIERFQQLPDDVRPKVLQAAVLVADDGDSNVRVIVEENLAAQTEAVLEFVGPGVIELESPTAAIDEARRLAGVRDSGVTQKTIPIADVDESIQIVEATDIIPHSWAGEPRARR